MHSRWAGFAVIVLWLTTMTWLVTEKVLPPLLIGDPPDSRTILAARQQEPLVGWRVRWNEEPIGWALSLTRPLPDESTQVLSRVHFDRLPLGKLAPGWLRALFDTLATPTRIKADAKSRLTLDARGQLAEVESAVRFEPLREEVSLRGKVDGTQLALSVRSGDLTHQTTIAIDSEAIHGEALSPQTQLPGLHEGQKWTIEVCSPLGYPNNPVEVLEARVAGTESLLWHGQILHVWRVEYYGNPGSRLSRSAQPRGRLWVRRDGAVLAQEISLFSSRIKFERMGKAEAVALARQHGLVGLE